MEISALNVTPDFQIQAENKGPASAMNVGCCPCPSQGLLQIKAKLLYFSGHSYSGLLSAEKNFNLSFLDCCFSRRNMQYRRPQLKEGNPVLRPVNIYILSCTVNPFHSLFQPLICSMLLQPVPFPTSPRASYKHYCHLPSISLLCVRQEHWASSGKETCLSQDLTLGDTVLKDT